MSFHLLYDLLRNYILFRVIGIWCFVKGSSCFSAVTPSIPLTSPIQIKWKTQSVYHKLGRREIMFIFLFVGVQGQKPEMGRRRTSKENLGFGRVDMFINPWWPSYQSFSKSCWNIKTRMNLIPFLVVVNPVMMLLGIRITEHSNVTPTILLRMVTLPSLCFEMGPPMCSVEDKNISSFPSRWAPIHGINSQGLDPFLANPCLTLMNQEMGHIVFNCTLVILSFRNNPKSDYCT